MSSKNNHDNNTIIPPHLPSMSSDTAGGSPWQHLALKLVREVARGIVARVTEVLAEGASVDGTREFRPIVMAVTCMNLEMTKFLITRGADVNPLSDPAPQHCGFSFHLPFAASGPLFLAASCGRVDIVRVLLQAGADPNIVDMAGVTPLMAGCGVIPHAMARFTAKHIGKVGKGAGGEKGLWVETGRELLMAGADPLTTDQRPPRPAQRGPQGPRRLG